MLIKYYDNKELTYTSRKRYRTFNFEPFAQEIQKRVLLGDGAKTSIKTSINNLCNYVTIDDTRWFVVNHTYMNGGQITLNLQRDVIGEFGIGDCFGKIERGYTNTILKNRKELGLNQILKKRSKLIPNTSIYGNYAVDNHKDELWGIIYLTKPSEGQITIPIPAFVPDTLDYDFIENNTKKIKSTQSILYFAMNVRTQPTGRIFSVYMNFISDGTNIDLSDIQVDYNSNVEPSLDLYFASSFLSLDNSEAAKIVENVFRSLANLNFFGFDRNAMFVVPTMPNIDNNIPDYNNVTILYEDKYYRYSMTENNRNTFGSKASDDVLFNLFKDNLVGDTYSPNSSGTNRIQLTDVLKSDISGIIQYKYSCYWQSVETTYTYVILQGIEAGDLIIDVNSKDLVNEPYYILLFPLFDVIITGNNETYNIDRDEAWNVWNNVILTLSGDNGYLVDAQIYPYCPVLTSVNAKIGEYPFFNINASNYIIKCNAQLLPLSDVKKEYIEREYSIISPEQSSKFTFNFYDYVKTINDNNGVNYANITIKIKTALKPFAIISSAVINPEEGTLMNMSYDSDLRGSQPSSNGFEASLASNAFETYKRQNSNYQQIFNLQKEQMEKEHSVELVNDITGTIINTTTSVAFGAIAGASMADAGLLNMFGTKTAGAVAGGLTFGATTGAAMATQTVMNEDLRNYEEYLLQANFNLEIGTIKNMPNSVNRISSFNELILKDFWYIIETYECSDYEKNVVDNYISNYAYGIGVFDYFSNYQRNGWFLKGSVIKSNYGINLHVIAQKELSGGIYYYE